MAGEILGWVHKLSELGDHTSINSAIQRIAEDREPSDRSREGREIPIDRSTYLRAWKSFRPVAHLWAAFFIWTERTKGGELEDAVFPFSPPSFSRFLALAESYQSFGEQFYLTGRRRGAVHRELLLDPSRTWRLPTDGTIATRFAP
jgi:hypothetical protein